MDVILFQNQPQQQQQQQLLQQQQQQQRVLPQLCLGKQLYF